VGLWTANNSSIINTLVASGRVYAAVGVSVDMQLSRVKRCMTGVALDHFGVSDQARSKNFVRGGGGNSWNFGASVANWRCYKLLTEGPILLVEGPN